MTVGPCSPIIAFTKLLRAAALPSYGVQDWRWMLLDLMWTLHHTRALSHLGSLLSMRTFDLSIKDCRVTYCCENCDRRNVVTFLYVWLLAEPWTLRTSAVVYPFILLNMQRVKWATGRTAIRFGWRHLREMAVCAPLPKQSACLSERAAFGLSLGQCGGFTVLVTLLVSQQ